MQKVSEFLYVYFIALLHMHDCEITVILLCVCRGVGMKFKLEGLTLLLLNIKNDQKINSSVVKGNKLFSYF